MNTLSETINLPLALATLTSVGLHTLIWFSQPVVPMADKPTAVASDRRSVKVVQLTPDEILRLPQYAQQTVQPTLPSLPQEQIPTNLLPNLPRAQSEVTLPPPPSFPIYNPSPVTPPTTSESKTQNSRPRTRTTVPKSPQDSAKNNQSSQRQQSQTEEKPTPEPLNSSSQSQTQETTSSQNNQTQQTQTTQSSSGLFMGSYERFLAQQNLDTTSENTQTPQTEIKIEGNQKPNNEPTTGSLLDRNPLQPNLSWGANNNQNQNRNEPNTTPTNNGNNSRNNSEQLVGESRLKAIYGYNNANTTIGQGIENFRQWLDENNKKYGDRLNTKRKPIPDTIRSQINVQLPDVTPAGIAVLVDPEGKIVGEPKLIRSTGYEQLNQLAIEQVKKRSFSKTGKYEVYQYSIDVDQKDLPTATGAGNS
jgi:hypothetical protein